MTSSPRSLALVTGGSRGLGQQIAAQLLEEGFLVLEFSRAAPHPWSVMLDLGRPEDIRPTLDRALGDLDLDGLEQLVVVGNAGSLAPIGPSWRQPREALRQHLQINLGSAIEFYDAVLAHFQHRPMARKVIGHITSGAAHRPHAGLSLYCATKAGMEQYIRALAEEQRGQAHPFTAVALDPGALDTDMQAQIRAAAVEDLPVVTDFIERQRQGRLRDPAAVARTLVAALLSPTLEPGPGASSGHGGQPFHFQQPVGAIQ